MWKDPLADLSSVTVGEDDMMARRRPVDASKAKCLIVHGMSFSSQLRTSHRDHRRSLYWRSDHVVQVRRGLPTGRGSRPIRRGTRPPLVVAPQGGIWSLPTNRLGPGKIRPSGRRPQLELRFATLHFVRAAAYVPRPSANGTGGTCDPVRSNVQGGGRWALCHLSKSRRAGTPEGMIAAFICAV